MDLELSANNLFLDAEQCIDCLEEHTLLISLVMPSQEHTLLISLVMPSQQHETNNICLL